MKSEAVHEEHDNVGTIDAVISRVDLQFTSDVILLLPDCVVKREFLFVVYTIDMQHFT